MIGDQPLRRRILLLFAALAGTGFAAIIAGLALAAWRLHLAGAPAMAITDALALAALVAGLGCIAAATTIWLLFDRNVARPIEALAGGLRTGQPPDEHETRYLADLGPAVRDAALARTRAAEALAQTVREHASEMAHEKETLEAILADFGAGAVMTDLEDRIVFYNSAAAGLINGIVLGRPLRRYVDPAALEAGAARLGPAVQATDLVCKTMEGRVLTGRMRRLDDGILYIFRDRDLTRRLPQERLENLRRHAATLVPLLDALDGPIPPELAAAIRHEGHGLAKETRAISELSGAMVAQGRASLAELAAGLESKGELPDAALVADAHAVHALLLDIARRLKDWGADAHLEAEPRDGDEMRLRLVWQGEAVPMGQVEAWLGNAPDPAQPDLSSAEILGMHGTGMWSEPCSGRQAALVLPLAVAVEGREPAQLIYDFRLGRGSSPASRLCELTCVVFDTETTGLLPTDRIVQIAGIRLADGRTTGERFDTLVNPDMPIPHRATEIHRITDAMVAEAPDMVTALTAFHHFADDAVLVAHNAPFDMGLLRAAQQLTGLRFDNQVLDTVLLSAMVWGHSADHSLDALAARMGVEIPAEVRHSAMGDAIATAEVFQKLVAALDAKGICTVEEVIAEARRFRSLIADANLSDKRD